MHTLPRATRVPAALATAALLLSACSSGSAEAGVATLASSTDTTTAETVVEDVDAEDALLAFTACMRENGADIPDPTTNEDGSIELGRPDGEEGATIDRDALRAAREVCGELLDGAELGIGQGNRPEIDTETFLAYAECMRSNGIDDFPDPDADGLPSRDAMQALDTESDAFQAAATTCAEEVGFEGGFGGGGGRGPGGGQGGGGQGGA